MPIPTLSPKAITVPEMIASAKREAAMRRSVYARRVADSRMSESKAAFEIACMDAIILVLEDLDATSRLI